MGGIIFDLILKHKVIVIIRVNNLEKSDSRHIKQTCGYQAGEKAGMNWEPGTDMCTLCL